MRFLLISDIEGKKLRISPDIVESVDFILLAGDITLGTRSLKLAERVFFRLSAIFPPPLSVYFIPGNHDNPLLSKEQSFYPPNFQLAHNRIFNFLASDSKFPVTLAGFGGASMGIYNNFAFEEREFLQQINALLENGEEKLKSNKLECLKILMVHDPPFNTNLDKTFKGEHVGSKSVRGVILNHQPHICVCGHIHESQGVQKIGNTLVINAGDWRSQKNYGLIEVSVDENVESSYNISVVFPNQKHANFSIEF